MIDSFRTPATCLGLALSLPYIAMAADTPPAVTPAPSSQKSVAPSPSSAPSSAAATEKNTQEQTAEKRKQITAEAMAAIGDTRTALMALDQGKKADALAALERVTGKLELILARDPKLALAPTNVGATTIEVIGDADKVRDIRKQAQRLLDDGQVQSARLLLENLASETVISVSNIPLASYPGAIKLAAKLIDDGKQDEAKKVLQKTLNTLVVTNTVIPLPVVAAQESLKDAEKLVEKAARTEDENKRLNALLIDARRQLEFAQVLGYGTKQDFKDLYAQLDEIKDKSSNGKSGGGFFTKIKASLAGLFKSSQPVSR